MKPWFWIAVGVAGFALCFPGAESLPQEFDAVTQATRVTPPEDAGYRMFPVRIMNRSTYEAYHYDRTAGKPAVVSYSVSRSGWVRVRMVRRDDRSILLRTLQDWTESHYGKNYRIAWDGNDASGNAVDPRDTFIQFEAKDSLDNPMHQDHVEASCRDPQITIEVMGRGPGAQGPMRVATRFGPQHRAHPGTTAFKGRLYVDFELAGERQFPAGTEPFIFALDPKVLGRPDALVTVNLDDGHDHVGTASLHLGSSTLALETGRRSTGKE